MTTSPEVLSALRPDNLELILFPTEKCNFRCTYCYEDFAIGKMAPSVQTGIRRLVQARQDLRSLQISWFGGEPLTAFDVVRDLSRFFQQEASARDMRYAANMTTNAYLLDQERFQTLVNYGVTAFQISLDGDEEEHNRTRRRANGAGSFARIIENLSHMHETDRDFSVMLRIHYHQKNIVSVHTLIDRLARLLQGDTRFGLFFKSVSALGSPNDAAFPFAHNPAALEKAFLAHAQGKFPTIQLSPAYICYACKANSLAIRANGRIAKCTVALNSPLNDVGYITPAGEIVTDAGKFQAWINPLLNGSQAERGCPLPAVLKGSPQQQQR